MNFGNLLDSVTQATLTAFRLPECRYFYEDRNSGERYEIQQCVERTVEFIEEGPHPGMTIVRVGNGFKIARAERDAIDEWRKGMNIDVRKEPTPFGGDFIIRIQGDEVLRYQINYREPFSVIGTNRTAYRINTNFVKKDG